MPIGQVQVIYDGVCTFCTRILRFAKRLDAFGAYHLIDGTDPELVRARFPGISLGDTAEAMIVVTQSGQIFTGFYAFRQMVRLSPWLTPLVAIFYFPGASAVGPWIYRWVARNRQRLGRRGETCESKSAGR